MDAFTTSCKPNSLIISISLLCLLAVLLSVICCLPHLISGTLKCPAITTFVLCVFYIVFFPETLGGFEGIGDGNWGSVVGCKVN